MKKIMYLLLIIIFSSCGVSNSDKMKMNNVLGIKLREMYSNKNISTMFLKTEILSSDKSKDSQNNKEYYCSYRCEFEESNQNITIWGDVRFNEDFEIVKMPEYFGENKYDISASIILINSLSLSDEDINKSKYVLDYFTNRNNLLKNNK